MPESLDANRRADSRRNEERILTVAKRLLEHSPTATLSDIAAAAGVSRSTLYRHFPDRVELLARLDQRPEDGAVQPAAGALPTGRLGRTRPLALDAIHVFDAVPPALLPGQLVAEAERIAAVPVALYLLDIDGSHLLHIAGDARLGELLGAPFAGGPAPARGAPAPPAGADRGAGGGGVLPPRAARRGAGPLPPLGAAARV